jgi:DNA-directed RNA polymerase subunit RPC12/RpoP
MPCPDCGSDRLAIRQRSGWEAVVARFTNTRKYLCIVCKREFRMADRRRQSRDGDVEPKRKVLKIPIN